MTKKSSEHHNAKRLARLAAVQGLYRIEMTQHAANDVIGDFRTHPPQIETEQGEKETLQEMDQELFGEIVAGVTQNTASLDEMIAGALDAKVSAGRIEVLLRAILRAGAYELHHHGKIPAGIIINDYVDVAQAFFGAKEPGLVNAVLDRLAKGLRAT